MFKSILVPTDFSENCQRALETAVALADRMDGKVVVMHVIETLAETPDQELESFYTMLEKRAEKKMAALTTPFSSGGVPVETRLVFGNRAAEILKMAQALSVDLIVLASRRIDLSAPTRGWGTISQKVALLSQCTVMMVK
jgi:universal stress protein A